jgi:hypothetical protein
MSGENVEQHEKWARKYREAVAPHMGGERVKRLEHSPDRSSRDRRRADGSELDLELDPQQGPPPK